MDIMRLAIHLEKKKLSNQQMVWIVCPAFQVSAHSALLSLIETSVFPI